MTIISTKVRDQIIYFNVHLLYIYTFDLEVYYAVRPYPLRIFFCNDLSLNLGLMLINTPITVVYSMMR